MKITITGASDDLIEIGGAISEEFDGGSGDLLLLCGDGSVLRIVYDNDGIWRVSRLIAGSATFALESGDIEKDTFDIATMEGDIKWIACGNECATPKKTMRTEEK